MAVIKIGNSHGRSEAQLGQKSGRDQHQTEHDTQPTDSAVFARQRGLGAYTDGGQP